MCFCKVWCYHISKTPGFLFLELSCGVLDNNVDAIRETTLHPELRIIEGLRCVRQANACVQSLKQLLNPGVPFAHSRVGLFFIAHIPPRHLFVGYGISIQYAFVCLVGRLQLRHVCCRAWEHGDESSTKES